MANGGLLLIGRGLAKLARKPMGPLSGLGGSLFFLLVYNAGFGGIDFLPEFGGSGYFAFIFPLGIVSLAMGSAAGAGQALHTDMTTGYFRRLYLSPAPRVAFVAAPLIADGTATLLVSGGLLGVGAIFGLPFRFGALSVLGILGISLLWGITLSGLSAAIMLRTGSGQGAQLVTTAVFPLIFLSTTFLPRELISSRWLLMVSRFNPITYLLEGLRYLLAGGIGAADSPKALLAAVAVAGVGAFLGLILALTGARKILV